MCDVWRINWGLLALGARFLFGQYASIGSGLWCGKRPAQTGPTDAVSMCALGVSE